jgi:hypothetical protein
MKDIIPTPEPLKYSEASDRNQVSCARHLKKYGISVGSLDKVQSKVMAHMLPTQIMNPDTGVTDMQPACTLPQQLLSSYGVNPISCGLENDTLHPAFGDMNVMKGCVMKTADPNGYFPTGNTYSDRAKVRGFLDNAAVALDADSQRYLESMRTKKLELEGKLASIKQKRQDIRDIIEPIRREYFKELTICENEIKQNDIRKNSMDSSRRPESRVPTQSDVEIKIQELESLHANYKEKILRNLRDLSFVSTFRIESQGWVGPKHIADLDFIKQATPSNTKSFTKPVNLSISDVYDNDKIVKAGGEIHREENFVSINWNDQTRTIFIPPGMEARFFEHTNFQGKNTGWIGHRHNPETAPTHNNLFPSGWDRQISSVEISGVFNNRAPNREGYVTNVINNARRTIRTLRPTNFVTPLNNSKMPVH